MHGRIGNNVTHDYKTQEKIDWVWVTKNEMFESEKNDYRWYRFRSEWNSKYLNPSPSMIEINAQLFNE